MMGSLYCIEVTAVIANATITQLRDKSASIPGIIR
jgi:hypothetical protein